MHRVLIANRGEIALRIVRACHEEGLEAIAVCSPADRTSPHVRAADRAIALRGNLPAESYLDIRQLIDAASASGADAVHPGYGFLAERADFAEAVVAAGLIWVGPPAAAIRAMGDKTEARRRMHEAGVPIVPGMTSAISSAADVGSVARDIGFPVIVKAAAGGGGKGMRVVHEPAALPEAIATAQREAEKAFGDSTVYLEKFVERPRHVEIQVLADATRTVHLGERECSLQRRHQKVVEEAPSPAVDPALRAAMGAAAVAAATAVGYRGAGTCEFLLAADRAFYFLEMNTRIQVEHPVTELVYGVDLVREQLRIAAGLAMSVTSTVPSPQGAAIECRITSEDPASGFLPSTGEITFLRVPAGPGVRWDAGVETGSTVTLFYDSMIAKLIVWAEDRPQAIRRMARALSELVVVGVSTNQSFHVRLMHDAAFQRGDFDIQFLERRDDLATPEPGLDLALVAVVAALAEDEARLQLKPAVAEVSTTSTAWREAARREGTSGWP